MVCLCGLGPQEDRFPCWSQQNGGMRSEHERSSKSIHPNTQAHPRHSAVHWYYLEEKDSDDLTKNLIFLCVLMLILMYSTAHMANSGLSNYRIFFFLNILLAFSGFIDSTAEECDRKRGKRGGVTRSKGARLRSRTRVCCRASAHGSRATSWAKRRSQLQNLNHPSTAVSFSYTFCLIVFCFCFFTNVSKILHFPQMNHVYLFSYLLLEFVKYTPCVETAGRIIMCNCPPCLDLYSYSTWLLKSSPFKLPTYKTLRLQVCATYSKDC